MTILLLGGSGRLGGAFRRHTGAHEWLSPSRDELEVANADVVRAFMRAHGVQCVINTIAYNNVDAAEGEGWTTAEFVNGQIPGLLARLCAEESVPFIHFSTDYVFSGSKKEGYVETDVPDPINAYGRSKLMGEQEVLSANPSACVIRVSRLFGQAADSPNAKADFIEIVKMKAAQESELAFSDAEVSCPTWVDDVAAQCVQYILPQVPAGIFHMANAGACSWKEWAEEIVRQLALPVTVVALTVPRIRPAVIPARTEIISTRLPAMRSWQEALTQYLLR